MITARANRLTYLALAVATIVTGLCVHRTATALHPIARDMLGDALWAMMIVWWLGVLAPSRTGWPRALVAWTICAAVELSQLVHGAAIDAIRQTTLGSLVLGTGFDTRDLLSYAVGVAVASMLARWAIQK